MEYFDEKSSSYLSSKRFFSDFLDDRIEYKQKVIDMIEKDGTTRLIVNVNDLRSFNEDVCRQLLERPMQFVAPFQSAVRDFIKSNEVAPMAFQRHEMRPDLPYTVGFDGQFGSHRVSPRLLTARHLGRLVCVEGIATRCSIVRPKTVKTVHFCPKTLKHTELHYHDATSLTGFPTTTVQPSKDLDGNALVSEYGLSQYEDHQTLTIQEMPEKAPAGLLPSSVDVVLDADLVDSCKPGDRVAVIGIYRAIPSSSSGSTSGLFKSVLIANNVKPITKSMTGQQTGPTEITFDDLKNIRKVAKRPDFFHLLARSIAPSIHGHEKIKEAVALLLLGGVEKNLENGTHIRGDINLLMVGDPSTAKSQLLRFVLNIAPLAINTTGRGSSGVGLTAAVTTDKETGERRLEAGAMVIADRGVVCIDEFDKMSDADRVSIHEVMEQQTVTIAKAGIHMSLNARCSVVAAANPRYSQYDTSKSPSFNVALPDSLLSRFDFLFIILDTPDPELDRAVSRRVLANHRYLEQKLADDEEDTTAVGDEDLHEEDGKPRSTPVYQKFDRLLHQGLPGASTKTQKTDILTMAFMKKYLQFSKEKYEPILTAEAAKFIGDAYSKLRQDNANRRDSSHPITARALETLIRLSTAHAKGLLRDEVTVDDCQIALDLMRYAIEGTNFDAAREKQKEKERKIEDRKAQKDDDEDSDNGSDDADDDVGGDEGAAAPPPPPPREDFGGSDTSDDEPPKPIAKKSPRRTPTQQRTPTPSKRVKTRRIQDDEVQQRADEEDGEVEMEYTVEEPKRSAPTLTPSSTMKSPSSSPSSRSSTSRRDMFARRLVQHMRNLMECELDDIEVAVNKDLPQTEQFGRNEIVGILERMEKDNQIMFRNDVVHRL